MKQTMKIKLNVSMMGYPEGHEIDIELDKRGNPTDKFWRNRIRDSKSDNCIQIVSGQQSESTVDEESTKKQASSKQKKA